MHNMCRCAICVDTVCRCTLHKMRGCTVCAGVDNMCRCAICVDTVCRCTICVYLSTRMSDVRAGVSCECMLSVYCVCVVAKNHSICV